MNKQNEKLTYDREELAKVLGVSPRAISTWTDSGKIPQPLRLGRRRLWLRETVQKWLSEGAPICRTPVTGPRSRK